MTSHDETYAQIKARLVESGEYERMSAHIKLALRQAGWYDQVHGLVQHQVSQEDVPQLDHVMAAVNRPAMAMVPDAVKLDTLQRIKQFLDQELKQ